MNVEDAPADFVSVLNHALTIISWQENLPEDEMPKHWMWHLDWEIEEWFKNVKINREAKYGRGAPAPEPEDRNLAFEEFERELRS